MKTADKKIKIFKLNDSDWVAAETLEEAKKCLAEHVSDGRVTPAFEEEYIDDPEECSHFDLQRIFFRDEDEPNVNRSFFEELHDRIERGETFPQFFAATEY